MRFRDKVVAVTGATKEAGGTIARRFAAEGAAVACFGRSEAEGRAVAERINGGGGRAIFVATDMADETQVAHALSASLSAFGRLDVIINNAAATDITRGSGELPASEEQSALFDQILKVNLYGPFWMAKYGLAAIQRSGGGAFLSVSSIMATRAGLAMPAYVASKAGLEGLTRQIATDYGAHGIRANAVALGAMRHSENEAIYADTTHVAFRAAARMIADPCRPDDLAELLLFLASDAARFITGTVIPLDGGSMAKYLAPPVAVSGSEWAADQSLR